MSLLNKLTQVAKSKQGQEMLQKAKTFANDPKTRAKLDEARGKFTEQVDAAKQKMAEKKAKDEADGSTAAAGDAVADAPAAGSAPADDAPAPVDETPAPPADPAYGDDGPKAA
jgi:hypothetical protein